MSFVLILDVAYEEEIVRYRFESSLGFVFEKALYLPYTQFSGTFIGQVEAPFEAAQVQCVTAEYRSRIVHYGMPDKIVVKQEKSHYKVTVTSRSYTMLLAQNEPYPRINTNVTLQSLCQRNLVCDRINYEDPTPQVGNIYVREHSTVWDAAVAYCIKASGRYPYISGCNTVMMTVGDRRNVDISGKVLLERGSEAQSGRILSDVYMKELDDDYPFEAHDTSAASMGIVRTRYYPLDMQWLYDPQVGLQHKLDISNRAAKVKSCSYLGYLGEDLMDTVTGGGMSGKRINSIRVKGSPEGVITTLKAYDDRYGQRS